MSTPPVVTALAPHVAGAIASGGEERGCRLCSPV
jgi:hypothetical protein